MDPLPRLGRDISSLNGIAARPKLPEPIKGTGHLQSPDDPPHSSHRHTPWLGGSIGLLVWLVEIRDCFEAVTEPFADCDTTICICTIIVHMNKATYAGLAFWILLTAATTVGGLLFLLGRLKWPLRK